MTCNPYTRKTMKTDFFYPPFVFEEFLNWSIESLSWEKVKLWKVFLPSILSNIRKQMFVLLFLFLLLIEKDQFRGGLESKCKAIILFIGGFRSKYLLCNWFYATLLSGGGERLRGKSNPLHSAQSILLIFLACLSFSKVYFKGKKRN